MITLALLVVFAFAVSAMAASKKDITIKVVGKCAFGEDKVCLTVSTPGFPTIKNEATGEVYHNPAFVSVRQIDTISWEIIKDGWGLGIWELIKGKEWGVDPCNGHLLIKAKVCVPSGAGIQLLAKAWKSDGGVYELFYDDPARNPEYMLMFGLGKGCRFGKLPDQTTIAFCGNYCTNCSQAMSLDDMLYEDDDISSMQMTPYSPGDVSETEAGPSYEVPIMK